MNNRLTIERLFKLLKNNLLILILWVVGIFSVTALFTFYVVEPEYQSVSRIVVNHTPGGSNTFTSTEINTNLSLIHTYEGIIVEPIILEKVANETAADVSVAELQQKISFEREAESLIFGLVITDSNPERAAQLANATAEIFQREVIEILPVESVTILSEATVNRSPISPNILQNLFFGLAAGIFVGFLHIFLKDLVDKHVKDEEIITELEWLNLGSVYEMSQREVEDTSVPTIEPESKKFEPMLPRTIKDRGVKYE